MPASDQPTFDFNRYAATGGRRDRAAVPREPLGKLFDRNPPFALEAEMSLLGSMILDPRVIGDVIQAVRGPEAFYDEKHGAIFSACVHLFDKHHTGDLVQLSQALTDKGVLEQIGGTDYLIKLAEGVPTAVNAPHFARIVAEKYKLRRLIDAAGQILYETYHVGENTTEAAAVIDAAEQKIFEIAEEELSGDPQGLHALLMLEYERLMALETGEGLPDGVRCGFYDLDEMLGGFQPGEMIIIAARPSMGKTAFALNLAEQMAMGTSEPASMRPERITQSIGVFSLEMSKQALVQRLLSSWSGYASTKIRRGMLSTHDYEQLLTACGQLGQAPIFIDDTPGLSILQLRARARRMVHKEGVKAIIVDYLQLLSSPASARESRQVEVSSISRGVKALARELKVPVIILSQLNRGPENRDHNKPRLSDLRESGSLEQDADVVMLLHREEYYHIGDHAWLEDPMNSDKVGVAEIIIAKQRNGPTGTVKLTWDASTTRFKNHADARPPSDADRFRPESSATAGASVASAARPALTSKASAPSLVGGKRRGPTPTASTPMILEPPRDTAGGFVASRPTGPVPAFRDGGGPDREDEARFENGFEDDLNLPPPPLPGDDSAPF